MAWNPALSIYRSLMTSLKIVFESKHQKKPILIINVDMICVGPIDESHKSHDVLSDFAVILYSVESIDNPREKLWHMDHILPVTLHYFKLRNVLKLQKIKLMKHVSIPIFGQQAALIKATKAPLSFSIADIVFSWTSTYTWTPRKIMAYKDMTAFQRDWVMSPHHVDLQSCLYKYKCDI